MKKFFSFLLTALLLVSLLTAAHGERTEGTLHTLLDIPFGVSEEEFVQRWEEIQSSFTLPRIYQSVNSLTNRKQLTTDEIVLFDASFDFSLVSFADHQYVSAFFYTESERKSITDINNLFLGFSKLYERLYKAYGSPTLAFLHANNHSSNSTMYSLPLLTSEYRINQLKTLLLSEDAPSFYFVWGNISVNLTASPTSEHISMYLTFENIPPFSESLGTILPPLKITTPDLEKIYFDLSVFENSQHVISPDPSRNDFLLILPSDTSDFYLINEDLYGVLIEPSIVFNTDNSMASFILNIVFLSFNEHPALTQTIFNIDQTQYYLSSKDISIKDSLDGTYKQSINVVPLGFDGFKMLDGILEAKDASITLVCEDWSIQNK